MKLTYTPREKTRKSQAKKQRREGKIPAVFYCARSPAQSIWIEEEEFAAVMRSLQPGHLPNTIFSLEREDGTACEAIIKEIQYHKVTYSVLHLDLMELTQDRKLTLNIPVRMRDEADCLGVKEGGALRLVKRHVRLSCLPENIPEALQLSVLDLPLKGSKRVRDLELPEGVRVLATSHEVVAVVGKR